MNAFTVLAIFISYWQCCKAMKIQTPQLPRDSRNYNTDCWSMKKCHLAKWPSWLPLAHPPLSLTSKSCLFSLLDKHIVCYLARADVCLIRHLLLPSWDWGKSHCSLYFLFCLKHLSTASQSAEKRKDKDCFENYLFRSWKVIPCVSICRT